ncbi:MAG: hypothetical protein WDM81_20340 [Rhizomicrobium sp.]
MGAAAQDRPPAATGAPTPLGGPDPLTTTTPPPPDDQPPAADTAPVEYKPGILGSPARSAVVEGDLSGPVDGPPVGMLDESQGGLGPSMWVNSPREAIEDLLGRIPFVSADPFARGLSRRILLTPSEAPAGSAKRALVTIRIEKLLQGGAVEDAGTIAAALRLDNDPDFARVQADALLYAGRDKDVCGDLTATRQTSPEPFWLELRIYCFAAGGDTASAELAHAALDGLGAKDPALDSLAADVLTGAKRPVAAIDHPTSLHIYLLRKAGLPITNAIAAKLGTAANAIAARDPRNPPADRLSAASRIAATGALSNAELLAILNAQAIPAKDLAQAQANAAKLTFLPSQGLLRRAALPRIAPAGPARPAAHGARRRRPSRKIAADRGAAGRRRAGDQARRKRGGRRPVVPHALVLNGKSDAASAWFAGAATAKTCTLSRSWWISRPPARHMTRRRKLLTPGSRPAPRRRRTPTRRPRWRWAWPTSSAGRCRRRHARWPRIWKPCTGPERAPATPRSASWKRPPPSPAARARSRCVCSTSSAWAAPATCRPT